MRGRIVQPQCTLALTEEQSFVAVQLLPLLVVGLLYLVSITMNCKRARFR